MIELRFHPSETVYPSVATPVTGEEEQFVIYSAQGVEVSGEVTYNVTTYSMYFKENLAIGVGYKFFPRSPLLGYHAHDVEHVSVYYYAGEPVKVYFSAHCRGQGVWVPWNKCEKSPTGLLVVYVALNSHALYPHSGSYLRVFGFANDHCSTRGKHIIVHSSQMLPSQEVILSAGVRLYKGLRPAPSSQSTTPLARFFLPFSSSSVYC